MGCCNLYIRLYNDPAPRTKKKLLLPGVLLCLWSRRKAKLEHSIARSGSLPAVEAARRN